MKLSKLHLFMVSAALLGACFGAPKANADVLDDNSPGSFLVFPKFDIRADTSTQLRIVNNNGSSVNVMLNYVCPGVKHVNEFCAALNTEVELTEYQTRIIDVADQNPPCNQGYVVAFAINSNSHPISYNKLTGSYHVTQGHRLEADNAISVQSTRSSGSELGSNGQLRFGGDGSDYRAMPQKLYTDFRAIAFEPDTGSRVTLLTLDVLAGMQNPPAVVAVDFWNSAEVPFSSSVEFICWAEYQLDDIDFNFLEDNLGTTYGQMKMWGVPNCPIPGACPPLNEYNATILGQISEYGDGDTSARNLFHDLDEKNTRFQPR